MVCIKPAMHIMHKPFVTAPRRRQEHSAEFKRELVAEPVRNFVCEA